MVVQPAVEILRVARKIIEVHAVNSLSVQPMTIELHAVNNLAALTAHVARMTLV